MLNQLRIKIKNMFYFALLFIISCLKLLFDSLLAIVQIKHAFVDKSCWIAAFYQLILLGSVLALFASRIDAIINSILLGQANFVYILLFFIILLTVILFINAIIEFVYRIKHSDENGINKNGPYNQFFSLQEKANNYIMSIISLIAIYVAIDATNANEINTILLACGILIFLCIVISDLYKALFISQDIVKDVYVQFKNHYNQHKL